MHLVLGDTDFHKGRDSFYPNVKKTLQHNIVCHDLFLFNNFLYNFNKGIRLMVASNFPTTLMIYSIVFIGLFTILNIYKTANTDIKDVITKKVFKHSSLIIIRSNPLLISNYVIISNGYYVTMYNMN